MTFDLVQISHGKDDRGRDVYRSFVQLGGRAAARMFADRTEMIETLRRILETQKREILSLNDLLNRIENGSHRFSGEAALDLTTDQARSLGWI